MQILYLTKCLHQKEASLRTALQNGCGGQAPCNTVEKAVLD